MATGFEILGAISGGAGLTGLLLNSIKNVNAGWTDAKNSRRRLELRHSELRYCERRMGVWVEKWERPLQQFWTPAAKIEIEELKQGMFEEAQLVMEYIGGGKAANDPDAADWIQRLQNGNESKIPHPSLWVRITYGLWKGDRLEKCISNLEKYITTLEKRTDFEYYKVCKGINQFGTSPQMQEIVEAEMFFDRVRKFDMVMESTTEALNIRRQRASVCGLLTAPLEDAHNCIFTSSVSKGRDSFTLSFLADARSVPAFARLNVMVSFSSITAERYISNLNAAIERCDYSEITSTERCELGRLLSSTIRDLSFIEGEARKEGMKASQLWRARAALDCAIWTSLMWESQWLGRLCGCSIVAAKLDDGKDQQAFLRDSALFANFPYTREECKCARLTNKPWRSLGLLLAELAIGQVLDVSQDLPDTLWVENGQEMVLIKQETLLDNVQKCTSSGYYQAVLQCFSSNFQEATSVSKQVRMRFITSQIVKPLSQYHKVVQRRRQRLEGAFLHMERSRLGMSH
jgi:hypothetical protein